VLLPASPGVDSLTSSCPSELRATPCSRLPVARTLAVYNSFSLWVAPSRAMAWQLSSWGLLAGCRSTFGGDVPDGFGEVLRDFVRQILFVRIGGE
jgi:hypothetical protein